MIQGMAIFLWGICSIFMGRTIDLDFVMSRYVLELENMNTVDPSESAELRARLIYAELVALEDQYKGNPAFQAVLAHAAEKGGDSSLALFRIYKALWLDPFRRDLATASTRLVHLWETEYPDRKSGFPGLEWFVICKIATWISVLALIFATGIAGYMVISHIRHKPKGTSRISLYFLTVALVLVGFLSLHLPRLRTWVFIQEAGPVFTADNRAVPSLYDVVPGQAVGLIRERKGWLYVSLPGDNYGWIPADQGALFP